MPQNWLAKCVQNCCTQVLFTCKVFLLADKRLGSELIIAWDISSANELFSSKYFCMYKSYVGNHRSWDLEITRLEGRVLGNSIEKPRDFSIINVFIISFILSSCYKESMVHIMV